MENMRHDTVAISRQDWTFDRRGEKDERRHNEKVKDAIKQNLGDLVSDGSIITADPLSKKKIKIPLRSLELPRFKFGDKGDGVGTGDGNGSSKPGDVVGSGHGEGAGNSPGEEYYEAEISLEEIQELVFEDLGLPNIKPRSKHDMETTETVFKDIRKKRTATNLDMGRTILQNILRNAQEKGEAKVSGISPEDYRVRTWEEESKPINSAVVIAMADISGSMGEFEKYITRAFCWWTVSFLRTKYPSVDIVFVAHDTEAHEVTEEQFFSRGSGGGTKCSSANKMALDITKNRYPTSGYNVYPLHFSDGDNYGNDNDRCVELVNQLLDEDISQYAYIQIGARSNSGLINEYKKNIHDPRFKTEVITKKEDVIKSLKNVFNPGETK